jgi:hypothetical protein
MNLSMIGNYLRAKWSKGLTSKRADVTTKDIRLLSCFGDSATVTVCPGLRPSERSPGKFICGECGCGDKKDTILNTEDGEYGKLDHPYVTCPRKMPGFSNYETDKSDERKVLIEVSIGKDILRNKELVNPTPPANPPATEPEGEKKGCSKCEAARKAREEAAKRGASYVEQVYEGNKARDSVGGSCPKCEERRRKLEEERAKMPRVGNNPRTLDGSDYVTQENISPEFRGEVEKERERLIQARKNLQERAEKLREKREQQRRDNGDF